MEHPAPAPLSAEADQDGMPPMTPITHNFAASLTQQQRLQHAATVMAEVEAMLEGYWQSRPTEPVVRRIRETWAGELMPYSLDEIRAACAKWVRENPRRKPNHGHITELLRAARTERALPFFRRMGEIVAFVAERHALPDWMLRGKGNRTEAVCDARAEAIGLCRDEGMPLGAIGEFFGGRDHTTILAALDRRDRLWGRRKGQRQAGGEQTGGEPTDRAHESSAAPDQPGA